jgi:thymidylate synthase
MENGRTKPDRSGFWLRSTFGYQMRFDLNEGFPLVTTKKMAWKGIVNELLWFIAGDTKVKTIADKDLHIWDGFANKDGEIGPMYGYQWRKWPDYNGGHIDQLKWAIEEIKHNPLSKAIVVSAWNTAQLKDMVLPPCHVLYQFYPRNGKLSMLMYQRSADAFLGVPFNIAQYALLLKMVAQVTGYEPYEYIHFIGDAHIYKNHKDAVLKQIEREPLPLPTITLNPEIKDIDDFRLEDIVMTNRQSYSETIDAEVVQLANVDENMDKIKEWQEKRKERREKKTS